MAVTYWGADRWPPFDVELVRAFLAAADQYWGRLDIRAHEGATAVNGEPCSIPKIILTTPTREQHCSRMAGAMSLWGTVTGVVATEVLNVGPNEALETTRLLFKRFTAGPLPMADIAAAAAHAAWLASPAD